MNIKTLKEAEKAFLKSYPKGFHDPEMIEIGKKHKMDKFHEFARESFSKKNFDDVHTILDNTVKLVSRSTMISLFEKPKFKDMVKVMSPRDKERYAEALFEILHGKEKYGFELLVAELLKRKLAKWALATVIQAYYSPEKEIFVKPTTTKLIVDKLDIDLIYKPRPSWEFYNKYRKYINEIKTKVTKNLSPNNPAFCGFLMMSLELD